MSDTENDSRKIISLIKAEAQVDVSQYKPSTIHRRILRQMKLHNFSGLPEYLKFLESNPEAVRTLADDIFVHVTQFFRDSDSFEFLKNMIFPRINENRILTVPLRIWVPGCSTGEEAYSIAISLLEFSDKIGESIPFQIFATDVSEKAVSKARSAVYDESEVEGVSAKRLETYFEELKDGFKIKKSVRDFCVFSKHDLTSNPPFARMNLITCRNVLIYFDTDLQKQVLPVFHYALNPKGYLWLGRTETPTGISKLFNMADKTHKVFSKIDTATPMSVKFPLHRPVDKVGLAKRAVNHIAAAADQQKEIDRIVFARYAPAGVVINEDLEIVQVRGHTAPYLELPAGQPSYGLLKMVRPELLPGLRMAIQQAKKSNTPVRKEGLACGTGKARKSVDIEIIPTNVHSSPKERQFLVFFEEAEGEKREPKAKSPKKKVKSQAEPDSKDAYIAELIQELDSLREYQQSMSEGYEATQEELTSTNEELQSTLEEFQSTNEELETAREELQATNEELVTVNEDLNARNEELARSEERFRLLVGAVTEYAIFMLDPDGKVISWNEGARRLKGYEKFEIVGRHFSKFYLPDDIERKHPQHELELARKEGKYSEEGWRIRKDGSRFWAYVVITRINDAEGNILGFSKVTRDLSERRQHEAALEKAKENLEHKVNERTQELKASEERLTEALRVRDEFLSVASHELKTPLTALKLEAQIIKRNIETGDRSYLTADRIIAFASQLDRKVDKLKELVDDMLDVSRIQRGTLALRPEETNLSHLVREVAQSFSSEIQKAGSELRLNVEDGIECFCDRFRIEQVIVNLLSNAAKYGSGNPIDLSCHKENENAVLTVKDRGIGISHADLQRIFERFERAISSSEVSGLGLGLYISKQILTLHQASISVKSEVGRGSEFKVMLPLRPNIALNRIEEKAYEF